MLRNRKILVAALGLTAFVAPAMASGLGSHPGVSDRGFVPSYARAPAQLAIKSDKIKVGFPANPGIGATLKPGYGGSVKPLPMNPNVGAMIKPNNQSSPSGYGGNPGMKVTPVPGLKPLPVNPNIGAMIKPNTPSGYGGDPGMKVTPVPGLKPLPVPPIVVAKTKPDYPAGSPVPPLPNQTPTTPPPVNQPSTTPPHPQTQLMRWPHRPGWYGTLLLAPSPTVASESTVVVPGAAATAVTSTPAPVYPVQASPASCNCLSKQYAQDGSVVFMDRCTNEVATTSPQ